MTMTRLEGAYGMVEIARRSDAEGDRRRAVRAYETVLRDFMHLSLSQAADVGELRTWLAAHPVEAVLDRLVSLTDDALQYPASERLQRLPTGNYLLTAFSHFCAALEMHERASHFAELAAEPAFFATPFWGEYGQALWATTQGRKYEPTLGSLKPAERLWLPHIELMLAAMRGDDLADAIAAVDRTFADRNTKGRASDNPYMIEGDIDSPVRFDFRKAGLLATIAKGNTGLKHMNFWTTEL